ncbi:Serine/threonine protein kinase [Trachipleistophora hominis]|uniref:protein kinase C n=1 Tax=Trachipleistophora hominis TaxID=72359 RepID=L7JUL4_TRAHO|nr:Serine/threonine protein kinase [Trachipleistophora hominis]
MKKLGGSNEDIVEKGVGKKTNGTVKFNIVDFVSDPLFECHWIDFYVDSELKTSVDVAEIKTEATKEITIGMQNNRDFEIILRGKNDVLLGMLFFACEYFMNYKNKKRVKFEFIQNATLECDMQFQRDIKLIRKNAEIICVYRDGHALENYKTITPFYCAVCNNIATFMDAYRCYKCRITCHKKCSNYILFYCVFAPEIEQAKLVKRYNIPHVLEDENASGFRYCNHCGTRIRLGEMCKVCRKCNERFHETCASFLPKSCGISLELRMKMADFNPPVQVSSKAAIKYEISDFSLVKVLGRGAFGKVMLAKKNHTLVAMKILKKEVIVNSNNIHYLDLERHILKLVSEANHPFLMKMLYCFQDEQNVYFGTEFLAGGDLFHYAATHKFTHEQIKLYVCEILLGLEFLHAKNIIYRDMKLDNVLICADGHVKIADFGLCKDNIGPDTMTYTFCGTADTIAPEVILGGGYTKDADWWSFGVVIYEMYENECPFNGSTTEEISAEILQTMPKFTENTPSEAQDLILKLLTRDPSERLGHGIVDGEEIRGHFYFKNINWNDVREKKTKPVFIPQSNLKDNF